MNQSTTATSRRLRENLLCLCGCIALGMILYGISLTYPFVWHEADDLSRTLRYSPSEYFTGMSSYEYYRPMMFLVWRMLLNAWGPDSAPMFHALSIYLHLLNAVLLFALARAITGSRLVGWAAAFMLVAYPFSYQAITWSTAHFHPAVLLLVLACVVTYARARLKTARWPTYALAAAFLMAGILVHETAFAATPTLVLVEAYLIINRRVPRWSRWPLLYVAVALAGLALYAMADKSPPVEQTFQLLSGLYLLQGLIYPVAMLLQRACAWAGCDSVALLLPTVAVTLIALLLVCRTRRALTLGLLGLAWFLLGAAPVWAGRDYVYIEYAPRLLYFAGAGTALALAAIADVPGEMTSPDRPSIGLALRLGIIVLIVLQSSLFVAARQPLYAEGFRVVEQENQATFSPRDGMALFINTIDLQDYAQREFPLGWFGVLVAPWHNRLGAVPHLRSENAEWIIEPGQAQYLQDRHPRKLEFHGRTVTPELRRDLLAQTSYVYQLRALLPMPNLHLFQIAEIERGEGSSSSAWAEWPNGVRLASASIEYEAGLPVLNLDWIINGPVDATQTVFVHVRDTAGNIVTQADGDPIAGLAPFSEWAVDDRIRERRPLDLPVHLPAGTYTVAVGLYDRGSLRRTAPTQANGADVVDGAVVIGTFRRE